MNIPWMTQAGEYQVGSGATKKPKAWRLVRNATATAFTRGQVVAVCNATTDAAGNSTIYGYDAGLADTNSSPVLFAVCGVVVTPIAAYGWGLVQSKGFCDYVLTDDSVVVAGILIPGTSEGLATGLAVGGTVNTAGTAAAFGYAMIADAGSNPYYCTKVMLDCRW